jgi:Helix-turn-helix domain
MSPSEYFVVKWRKAMWESDLPAPAKLVAAAMSDHMNARGQSCYPTIEQLAQETSLSVRAVKQHRGDLERAGWLRLVERGGSGAKGRLGARASSYEATSPTRVHEVHGDLPDQGAADADQGAGGAPTRVQEMHPRKPIQEAHTGSPYRKSIGRVQEMHRELPLDDGSTGNGFEAEFVAFWRVYPERKGSEQEAQREYVKLREQGVSPEKLHRAAENYADERDGDDPTYTFRAKNFLAKGEWHDYDRVRRGRGGVPDWMAEQVKRPEDAR